MGILEFYFAVVNNAVLCACLVTLYCVCCIHLCLHDTKSKMWSLKTLYIVVFIM